MENCEEDYYIALNDTSLLTEDGQFLSVNHSITCNRDKDKDLLIRYYDDYEAAGFTSVYTLLTVAALFGNCLMLYIVIKRTAFRTTPNVLLASLNLSNIFLSGMWVPLLWRPTYSRIFDNNTFFCKIAQSFAGINACCTEIVITAIVLYYVFNPRRLLRLNLKLSVLLALLLWLSAYAINVISLSMYTTKTLSLNVSQAIELKIDYHYLPIDTNGSMVTLKFCVFEIPKCEPGKWCFFARSEFYYRLIQTIILASFLYVLPFLLFSARLFVKQCFQKLPFSSNSDITREIQSVNCNLMLVSQIYALLWLPRICLALYANASQAKSVGEHDMKRTKLVEEICSFVSLFSTCAVPLVFALRDSSFGIEFKLVFSHLFICLPQWSHHPKLEDEFCGEVVIPLRSPTAITVMDVDSSIPLIDQDEETPLNNNTTMRVQ